jgi:hypothetical protein
MTTPPRTAADHLEWACKFYCGWYDRNEPRMDASAVAYELVTACRQALAALRAAPSPGAGETLTWLIETGASPTTYWDGRNVDTGFTDKADEACRFSRFEDAETVRCWLIPNGYRFCRSVQHAWITEPPAVSASPASPVIADVLAERQRQDAQWGGPEHDDTHHPTEWLGFVNKQIHTNVGVDVRDRLVKVAALALAGIESIDRKGR